jgi:hypothetical protein
MELLMSFELDPVKYGVLWNTVENNEKKLEEMNTGDSMYISPYTPHSFTTRKNKNNDNIQQRRISQG